MAKSGQNNRPDIQLLWEQMKNGKNQALATLFKHYYPLLYDYGKKISHQDELVKDSIQELFAYIWNKRKSLSRVESVTSYLMVAMRRQLFKAIKQQRKNKEIYQEFSSTQPQQAFSAEDMLVMNETIASERKSVKRALNKIPTRMREALYLKTYSGLSYKEIALIMQINPQVARNYVSEAFRRLRSIITEKSKIYE